MRGHNTRMRTAGLLAASLLSVAAVADASHLLPSGSLWTCQAAGSNFSVTVWDLATDAQDIQWFPAGGSNGRGVAYDPRDGNVVYVAAAQGGVWKTTDGGLVWAPLTDQL